MPTQEDYILRMIAQLRQAISQVLKYRESRRFDDALLAASDAQEKLFGRSTAELSRLSLDELLGLLRLDETREGGTEKVLGYAALLKETGLVYEALDQRSMAEGCFQLALRVMLSVALEEAPLDEGLWTEMRGLLARISTDRLQPPVQELLERIGEIP
jgi:hypothetical protein